MARKADWVLRTTHCVGAGTLKFRHWIPWATALVLTVGVPGTAFAQEAPTSGVRTSFTADRAELTVGDIVTLTLEVTHSAEQVVVLPRLGAKWGSFEVRSQTPARTVSNGDGTETTRQHLRVTIFAPGTFETPDLPVSVRSPDGAVEQASPPPVRLTVKSVLSGSDEQLRDIRPPSDLSIPLWKQPFARAMAALATLAALGLVGYILHRRSPRRAPLPVPVADTRTPWEVAVQELDRIERLDLPGDGNFVEHYGLASRVTRTYIYAMYLADVSRQDATDMTTDELGVAISRSSLDRKNARLAVGLLLKADLVRFSNYTPSVSEAYEDLVQARDIVDGTRPSVDESSHDSSHTQQEVSP